MGLTTDGMSPADLAAVTGNNNGAFGEGNGAWWIIILFLFIFCGWGNGNGWNNGGGGAVDNYVLASDFATLQRQIDSGISSLERKGDAINSGICDGFYAVNTSLLNGFAGTNSTIQQNGYDTRNAIQQGQITDMQSFNALQAQLAQCCCDNKQAIAGVNYNMAIMQSSRKLQTASARQISTTQTTQETSLTTRTTTPEPSSMLLQHRESKLRTLRLLSRISSYLRHS